MHNAVLPCDKWHSVVLPIAIIVLHTAYAVLFWEILEW